jgi:hypothetical protein
MSSRFGLAIATLLGLAALLPGCASPGAPQPPSLRLPKPVDDLTATRKGDHVILTWTTPSLTTDSENIRHVGSTDVCRGINAFPLSQCDQKLATLTDAQVTHTKKTTAVARHDYTDTLAADLQSQNPLGEATYALSDKNPGGHAAGLSDQVRVPLAPTLPPPAAVKAAVTADGVALTWPASAPPVQNDSLHYSYRVLRDNLNDPKQQELIAGEVPATSGPSVTFVDRNIDWEIRYSYHVTPITQVQQAGKEPVEVEGDDSPATEVLTHDIFPPATPNGLQAVYSGVGQKPFIDLTWAPNLERDLAGYNIYRHESGTAPAKINSELVKAPSYRDPTVQPGHTYIYSVSAVDERGNESGKSGEASEKAPE